MGQEEAYASGGLAKTEGARRAQVGILGSLGDSISFYQDVVHCRVLLVHYRALLVHCSFLCASKKILEMLCMFLRGSANGVWETQQTGLKTSLCVRVCRLSLFARVLFAFASPSNCASA